MHVFMIAAISVDGFIAAETSQVSTAWTSAADKQFFRQRTKQAGVVLFGSQTFQTFQRLLPGRVNIVWTRDVAKFRQQVSLPTVEFTASTTAVSDRNVLYVTSLAPGEMIARLSQCGCAELAVCGGSQVYTQFLQAGVIETLYLTVESMVFGQGIPLFSQSSPQPLRLRHHQLLAPETLLLEYQVAVSHPTS